MLMLEREAAQSALGVGMGTPAGPDRVRYVIRRLGSNVPHLGFRTAGTLMALAAREVMVAFTVMRLTNSLRPKDEVR